MPKVAKIIGTIERVESQKAIARAGWIVDMGDLKIQAREMGIEMKIRIRYTSAKYTLGTHRVKRDENGKLFHSITLDQNKKIDSANETLWHEMQHCLDAEIFGCSQSAKARGLSVANFYRYAYAPRGTSGDRYRNNIYEVRARGRSAKNGHIMILKEG